VGFQGETFQLLKAETVRLLENSIQGFFETAQAQRFSQTILEQEFKKTQQAHFHLS